MTKTVFLVPKPLQQPINRLCNHTREKIEFPQVNLARLAVVWVSHVVILLRFGALGSGVRGLVLVMDLYSVGVQTQFWQIPKQFAVSKDRSD